MILCPVSLTYVVKDDIIHFGYIDAEGNPQRQNGMIYINEPIKNVKILGIFENAMMLYIPNFGRIKVELENYLEVSKKLVIVNNEIKSDIKISINTNVDTTNICVGSTPFQKG